MWFSILTETSLAHTCTHTHTHTSPQYVALYKKLLGNKADSTADNSRIRALLAPLEENMDGMSCVCFVTSKT